VTRGLHGASFAVALAIASVVAPAGAADDSAVLAQGKALFSGGAVPPCALCHTLKDAGSSGAIGPVLDDLQPDAERVVAALKSGIGAMPSYRPSLSDEQMRALARYVAKASGGAK
jgi:sulfite dehydrogenase